nr:hypothetical protein [Tanacetum cinerariifolium]
MMELSSLISKEKFLQHVGVASWFNSLSNVQPDFVSKERILWVDIEGVPLHLWSHPTFTKIGSRWGEDSDVDGVSDTYFGHDNRDEQQQSNHMKQASEDLFQIYDLLKKQDNKVKSGLEQSRPYPPGFTPDVDDNKKVEDKVSSPSVGLITRIMPKSSPIEDQMSSQDKVKFLALQKTTMEKFSVMKAKYIRGNSNFTYLSSDSIGNSGGIVCMWESNIFQKDCHTVSDNFIAVYGTWMPTMSKILVIAIYAPQSVTEKRTLWQYITHLINRCNEECFVMGDFNEVRSKEERLGSSFNVRGANDFNAFIAESGLIDLHLEGYSFTWSHPSAQKMNTCPITDGFDNLMVDSWNGLQLEDRNDMVRFKKKLQGLKKSIREWVTDRKKNHNLFIKDTILKLGEIEKKLDCGEASEELLLLRMNLMQALQEKYPVMVNREWIVEPIRVKEAFRNHFASRFHHSLSGCSRINFTFPNRLSQELILDLENHVSTDEIRKAAIQWFFDHSNFPRGCNSSFVALNPKVPDAKFVIISDLVSDVQTDFVFGRQIHNGPFIINKLLSWCKRKKKQAMIFKVDFAKAYDSVRWDFLDDVLRSFSFVLNGDRDPLAPYLFILVMESLHLSFSRVVEAGEWSDSNLDRILQVFHCFYLTSGLKINVQKSSLMGVGINHNDIAKAASKLGCSILKTPFKYLGFLLDLPLPEVPKTVLNVMASLRSKFFNGSDGGDKKITWIKWKKVLAVKKNGGLRVLNFFALNRALLFRLATKSNLIHRGITLDSPMCPVCNLSNEDISYSFQLRSCISCVKTDMSLVEFRLTAGELVFGMVFVTGVHSNGS